MPDRRSLRNLARSTRMLLIGAASLSVAPAWAAPDGAFSPDGWRLALPGHVFRFPRDHAAHPDHRTEWWYTTGHLAGVDGQEWGFQLTCFRAGLRRELPRPGLRWDARDVQFGHFTLTDHRAGTFQVAERRARSVPGLAHARSDRYDVRQQDWSMRLVGDRHLLVAGEGDTRLELDLRPAKPPVVHGVDGVSAKSAGHGQASHYVSFSRLLGTGVLSRGQQRQRVKVQAWMDHEWGSNQMASDEVGWDWFSLQLDDGQEAMFYLLRRADGSVVPQSSGTWIDRSGHARHLNLADFRVRPTSRWTSPHTGATYPAGWQIAVPGEATEFTITPRLADQELVTTASTGVAYWEGAVSVTSRRPGRPDVTGKGYVELTGYDRTRRPRI
ncbi:MAG: lipocalin family protein [bacterium]|nr:lipocalin family protein [bacterium]